MNRRTTPAAFQIADSLDVGISEPSDVTALPGGTFLVVSDLEPAGVLVGRRKGRVAIPGGPDGESGFEAVAYDAERRRLFVVREERHELVVLAWNGTAEGPPEAVLTRALPAIAPINKKSKKNKKGRNKGIEGLTCLPALHSPTGRAHLLLAKEAKPRALVLLDGEAGDGDPLEIELDPRIEDACKDFSGLAIDPRSGHVFLCSDESATVAEIALSGDGGLRSELIGVTELRDRRGERLERVEGIAFDGEGDLFVLLENDCKLWRLARTQ